MWQCNFLAPPLAVPQTEPQLENRAISSVDEFDFLFACRLMNTGIRRRCDNGW